VTEIEETKPRRRQVFVSYAKEDKDVARQVAEALQSAGLLVWIDAWELAVGDSIVQRIDQAIASSDILLVILSKSSVNSKWVQIELSTALSRELRDRAITVIPALIEDCDIPPLLADRPYLDLRRDLPTAIKRLVEQISSVPALDFSLLDGRRFESMVGDLLENLGFSVQRTPLTRDSGFDLIASNRTRDPFGAEKTITWLVEVKLYRDQRVSVSTLRQMLGFLMMAGGSKKGLIVTNGRLTSVARTFLSESTERTGHELRVIDGTELTNLLIQHPKVVQTYFRLGGSRD
jgi:Holliday junction resolvase